MKRNGFTLLELLIVVIIIGILASLAIPRYQKTVESSKAAEAYANLNAIRIAEFPYRANNATFYYGNDFDTYLTSIDDPNLMPNRKFSYRAWAATGPSFTVRATREGGPYNQQSISMDANGNIDESQWLLAPSGGQTCLLKGTQVSMADGTSKAIDQIKIGDLVLGYKDNKIKPGKVVKTFFHPKRKGYLIVTTDDGREIKITGNHRVYRGRDYGQIRLLKPGDILFVAGDKALKVARIKSIVSKKEVADNYNIKVQELNNYFAQGVLVHNDKSNP